MPDRLALIQINKSEEKKNLVQLLKQQTLQTYRLEFRQQRNRKQLFGSTDGLPTLV